MEEIIIKLTEHISMPGFEGFETNEDRFIWARKQLDFNIASVSKDSSKSGRESEKYRNEGNKYFTDKLYKKALDLYTKSMIAAPSPDEGDNDDKHLAKSLSNRSAALFYLKEYEACLIDIEGALQAGYMEERRYLLYIRKVKCLHALQLVVEAKMAFDKVGTLLFKSKVDTKQQSRILKELENHMGDCATMPDHHVKRRERVEVSLPSLPYGRNASHPSLSSSCKVMYASDKGRHVVATRDIRPGEVILVEEPYSSILDPHCFVDHCDNCCCRLPFAPLACQHCTQVLYCSPKCRDNAWAHYHKYECSMGSHLYFSTMTDHLAFRTAMVAGLDELLKYKDESTPATAVHLGMEGCNEQGQYKSNDFNTISHLVNHSDKFTERYMLMVTSTANAYTRWLEDINFFQIIPPEEKEAAILCVGKSIMHISQVIKVNTASIMETVHSGDRLIDSKYENIGKALYPTYALLNHSCAGNTVRVSYANNVVVRANAKIKKGQEISTLYVGGYLFSERDERQQKLQQNYYFKCICDACVNNWPQFSAMTPQEALFKCQNCQHPLGPSIGHYPCAGKVCPGCKQMQIIPAKEVPFQDCRMRGQEATELISARKFIEALKVFNKEIRRLEKLLVSPRMHSLFMMLNIDRDKCFYLMGNFFMKEP